VALPGRYAGARLGVENMTDLYDRAISGLGLDTSREDAIYGDTVADFGVWPGPRGCPHGPVNLSLARRRDGQWQFVLRWNRGEGRCGLIPVTRPNLDVMEAAVLAARMGTSPSRGSAGSKSVLGWLRARLEGGVIADFGPLPDASEICQVAVLVRESRQGERALVFRVQGWGSTEAMIAASGEALGAVEEAIQRGNEARE